MPGKEVLGVQSMVSQKPNR